MIWNGRSIQAWDRYGIWNKSAGLYHGFSPPVVPQANGREWVLEVGKLFWSLKHFLLPLALLWALCALSPSAHSWHMFLLWAQCSHPMQLGTSLSVTSNYRMRERFNLWPEKYLLCNSVIWRLHVQVQSVYEKDWQNKIFLIGSVGGCMGCFEGGLTYYHKACA